MILANPLVIARVRNELLDPLGHTRETPIRAAVIAALLSAALGGCSKPQTAVAPPPAVRVAAVVQRDVPLHSEWIGTTQGNINARDPGARHRLSADAGLVFEDNVLSGWQEFPRAVQGQVHHGTCNAGVGERAVMPR